MSYAHDLHLYPDFDRRAFAMAVEDVRTLVARTEISIVGPEGRPHSFPIFDNDRIAFNGLNRNCVCPPGMPEDKFCPPECDVSYPHRNDSFQAFSVDVRPHMVVPTRFHLRGPEVYWFDCKTRRRPYDLLVMAALIALKHHLGDSMIAESSGRWKYEWKYRRGFPEGARGVYEHVFPDRAPVQNILDFEGDGS